MDATTSVQLSEGLIHHLLNDLGNTGSWIAVISIFLLPYVSTAVNWVMALSDRPFRKNKEYIDKLADALEENQETLASDLEGVYEILAGIDHKLKNFISGNDCLAITRKFFAGSLFEKISARSMYFFRKNREAEVKLPALKKQFAKEGKNFWSDLISNLNKINTPIRIGDWLNEKYYNRFFGKTGVMEKIIEITFEKNGIDIGFRYENIKATFDYFTNEIIDGLTIELDKLGKLRNGEQG